MGIKNTTDSSFDEDLQAAQAVLIDFWAPWCRPCLALAPHLDTLARNAGEQLAILKVNVDENPRLRGQFNIRGLPTLVFLAGGNETGRLMGTSVSRLNVTVEQWMKNQGHAAAGRALADTLAADGEAPVAPPALRAFHGDDMVKQQCLARLARIDDTYASTPAQLMTGPAASLAEALGIPEHIGALLDLLWRMNAQYELQPLDALRESLLALVRAIPVGADTGSIAASLHYEAMRAPAWCPGQYTLGSDARAVVDALQANHDREWRGEALPRAAWAALERQAILLPTTAEAENLSETLEALCVPLGSASIAGVLTALMRLAEADARPAPHWTGADARRLDEAGAAYEKAAVAEVGTYPDDGAGTERLAQWQRALAGFNARWDAGKRAADPLFWSRHDAQCARAAAIRADMSRFLVEHLSARFAALQE